MLDFFNGITRQKCCTRRPRTFAFDPCSAAWSRPRCTSLGANSEYGAETDYGSSTLAIANGRADFERNATKSRCPSGECEPKSIWRKAPRLHPLIPREAKRWRSLYRGRAAVEREFARLKHDYWLAPSRVRGLDRVALHADLTMLARLLQAIARAHDGAIARGVGPASWNAARRNGSPPPLCAGLVQTGRTVRDGRVDSALLASMYVVLLGALIYELQVADVTLIFGLLVAAYGVATYSFGLRWASALVVLPVAFVVDVLLHGTYGQVDCWPSCSRVTETTRYTAVVLFFVQLAIVIFAVAVLVWRRLRASWRGFTPIA